MDIHSIFSIIKKQILTGIYSLGTRNAKTVCIDINQ